MGRDQGQGRSFIEMEAGKGEEELSTVSMKEEHGGP